MTWRDTAACRGMDVNTFVFETGGVRPARKAIAAACAVCATCPVAQFCLNEELERMRHDPTPTVGIRAGTTQQDRRLMVDTSGGRRHTPPVMRPGTSAAEAQRLERNRRQNERRALNGRPDKEKEKAQRAQRHRLAAMRRSAQEEAMQLRYELWQEQQGA